MLLVTHRLFHVRSLFVSPTCARSTRREGCMRLCPVTLLVVEKKLRRHHFTRLQHLVPAILGAYWLLRYLFDIPVI